MSDKTLSAKEARVEIARLRQGVPLKPGIRKILANTLEVYADQMDDFYDDGRGIRARRGTDDMTETQETLHRHRDASLPYQEWNHPFKPDDIVTVSGRSGERTDRAKDLWWGYEREFGDVADAVILSARLATEEEKAELVNARSVESVKAEDRKSTRLNSSHGYISYAVFCLKKKKKIKKKKKTKQKRASPYLRSLELASARSCKHGAL